MVGDVRYFPVVLIHIHGQPTAASVDFMFLEWRQHAIDFAVEQNTAITNIVKLTDMLPPSATVRRRVGEFVSKDTTREGLLCTNIVLNSAVVRGILTAIDWVAGSDNAPATHARSVEHAIKNSLKALDRAGYRAPDIDSGTYELPKEWHDFLHEKRS